MSELFTIQEKLKFDFIKKYFSKYIKIETIESFKQIISDMKSTVTGYLIKFYL